MDVSIKLSEAVNQVGNALTAAEWPCKAVKYDNGVKIYDTRKLYKDLVFASMEAENELSDYHDCVNELCQKCGQYKHEHEGACNGCRWQKPRRGW